MTFQPTESTTPFLILSPPSHPIRIPTRLFFADLQRVEVMFFLNSSLHQYQFRPLATYRALNFGLGVNEKKNEAIATNEKNTDAVATVLLAFVKTAKRVVRR